MENFTLKMGEDRLFFMKVHPKMGEVGYFFMKVHPKMGEEIQWEWHLMRCIGMDIGFRYKGYG